MNILNPRGHEIFGDEIDREVDWKSTDNVKQLTPKAVLHLLPISTIQATQSKARECLMFRFAICAVLVLGTPTDAPTAEIVDVGSTKQLLVDDFCR